MLPGTIVKSPDFESAIVKLQSFKEDDLTTSEKGQLKDFKVETTKLELLDDLTPTDALTPDDNLIVTAMRHSEEIKRRRIIRGNYRSVKHVVPTSNKVE